jgi:Ion channel
MAIFMVMLRSVIAATSKSYKSMNLAKFFQWHHLSRLPSAWLLLVQLLILILAPLTNDSLTSHAISWSLSALALLLLATIIRNSPIFTGFGLFFVILGLGLSTSVLLGFDSPSVQVATNLIEAVAYFYGAAGLLMYMFEDEYLTRDELFAAAAVFTLLAWGFAFLYSVCQVWYPGSFNAVASVPRSWLELLFLSFSIQSGTGLSDITPLTPAARVLTALQMFTGVMYLALVVSRLVALQYIAHVPKDKTKDKK